MKKLLFVCAISLFCLFGNIYADYKYDYIDLKVGQAIGLFDGDELEQIYSPKTYKLNNDSQIIEKLLKLNIGIKERLENNDSEILNLVNNVIEDKYISHLHIVDNRVYTFENYYVLVHWENPSEIVEGDSQRIIDSKDIFKKNDEILLGQRTKENDDLRVYPPFSIQDGILPSEIENFPKLVSFNINTGEKTDTGYDFSLLEEVLYLSNMNVKSGESLRGPPYFKILGVGGASYDNSIIFGDISVRRFGNSFRGVYEYNANSNSVHRLRLEILENNPYSYKGHYIYQNTIISERGSYGGPSRIIILKDNKEYFINSLISPVGGKDNCNFPSQPLINSQIEDSTISTDIAFNEIIKTKTIKYKCGELEGEIDLSNTSDLYW